MVLTDQGERVRYCCGSDMVLTGQGGSQRSKRRGKQVVVVLIQGVEGSGRKGTEKGDKV